MLYIMYLLRVALVKFNISLKARQGIYVLIYSCRSLQSLFVRFIKGMKRFGYVLYCTVNIWKDIRNFAVKVSKMCMQVQPG